jgi:Ca2+-binding RTX toxin-like protein
MNAISPPALAMFFSDVDITAAGGIYRDIDTTNGRITITWYGVQPFGGGTPDTLSGDAGSGTIEGFAGADQLLGGAGNDSILGGGGGDSICGDTMLLDLADHATGPGEAAVNLTVNNTTDGAIELWRIELNGSLTFCQAIAANGTVVQPTFVSHNWVLRDPSGLCLQIIEVTGTLTVDCGIDGLDDTIGGGFGNDTITDFSAGTPGTIGDGDTANNDFVDLSALYENLSELYADQVDDGILNQSNMTDSKGRAVD